MSEAELGDDAMSGELATSEGFFAIFCKAWDETEKMNRLAAQPHVCACKAHAEVPSAKASTVSGLKTDEGKQQWYAMPLEILEPLAQAFVAGEKKYATFNCLQPFADPDRRFYDAQMRHTRKSQIDPLAIDEELKAKYGIEVYHEAQVAFSALMRLYNARMAAGGISA